MEPSAAWRKLHPVNQTKLIKWPRLNVDEKNVEPWEREQAQRLRLHAEFAFEWPSPCIEHIYSGKAASRSPEGSSPDLRPNSDQVVPNASENTENELQRQDSEPFRRGSGVHGGTREGKTVETRPTTLRASSTNRLHGCGSAQADSTKKRSRMAIAADDALVELATTMNADVLTTETSWTGDRLQLPLYKRRKTASLDEPLQAIAAAGDGLIDGSESGSLPESPGIGPKIDFSLDSSRRTLRKLSGAATQLDGKANGTRFPKQQQLAPQVAKGTKRKGKQVQSFEWPEGRKVIWRKDNPGRPLPERAVMPRRSPIGSHAPDPGTNILHLGDCKVSAVEILTYFPTHTIWREVMWRLSNNGWTENDMVQFILWCRQVDDPKALRSTTLLKQRCTTKVWAEEQQRTLETGRVTKFDFENASDARGNADPLHDYRLRDLAEGVVHHPKGEDAYILTAAINLAVKSKDDVLLSGFTQYVQDNWQLLDPKRPLAPQGVNPDVDSAKRWHRSQQVTAYMNSIGYERV